MEESTKQKPFEVWKSLELGRNEDATETRRRMHRIGCDFENTGAGTLLESVTYRKFPQIVQVADVTVQELGLKDGVNFGEIMHRARATEQLEHCPSEAAPELVLRHEILDFTRGIMNKSGMVVHLGMIPVRPHENGPLFIFRIHQEKDQQMGVAGFKRLEVCPITLPFKLTDRFVFATKSPKP